MTQLSRSVDGDAAFLTAENERLKQELRRLSGIVNRSRNPIWQRDTALNIIYCNDPFSALVEDAVHELKDFAAIELFSGHRDLAKKALETGQIQVVERYVIAGGRRRLFEIREVPAGDGVVTGYAVDISEAEKAREEVQRYISAQRDFLESSTSAIAIFARDMSLKSYNFAYQHLWKLDESFLDREPAYADILEVLREKRRLPEQANFRAFKQQHLRLFTDLIEPHEEFFYLPDGKILRVLIIPHALGGLMFVYEDVTDRLALERSYNTLIAVQRETLDNLQEAVVVIGEDGRIKLSNPTYTRLWHLDEKTMQREPHVREAMDACRHFFDTSHWEEFKEAFVARLGQRMFETGRLERTDGLVLIWRMIPLPDGGNLLTYVDITDSTLVERSLRERNEALEDADKLKSEFLANISYELRSPLTSISGFSDILRQNYFGDLTDKQREYVEGIHQSAQQLGSLINNILDLASIEAGYMQLDIAAFSLPVTIENVVNLLQERAARMDVRFRTQFDPLCESLEGDETRIRQVLYHLLTNALKYSHGGGEITIETRTVDAEWLAFSVTDQGVGIEPEHRQRIFDRFYRAGAAKSQQAGPGLGLSIVRSFIELHGGRVAVESEAGAGACFTCVLPRRPRAESQI